MVRGGLPPGRGRSSPCRRAGGKKRSSNHDPSLRCETALVSPGDIHPRSAEYSRRGEEIFKGAKIHAYRISRRSGNGRCEDQSDDGAYLLVVSFIGERALEVQMDASWAGRAGAHPGRLKTSSLNMKTFDIRQGWSGWGRRALLQVGGKAT